MALFADSSQSPKACLPMRLGTFLTIALPKRLEELFDTLTQMAAEITDPFGEAFLLTVHLRYLKRFEDVTNASSAWPPPSLAFATTYAPCRSSTCRNKPMWTACWACCTNLTAWTCLAMCLYGHTSSHASSTLR